MSEAHLATVSPFRAGIACRCPRCARGKLFKGYLDVAERCVVCSLDLTRHDSGDGPAVFVILVLGFIIVGLALVVERAYAPPVWLHMLVWLPLSLVGSLALLRPFKGVLIALQYAHRVPFESDHDQT